MRHCTPECLVFWIRRPGPEALAARQGNSKATAPSGHARVGLQRYADRGREAVGGLHEGVRGEVRLSLGEEVSPVSLRVREQENGKEQAILLPRALPRLR